ncbi:cobalamin biosynthesis protein CbiX [Burkholderia singularis]|uniref:Cobalamin biosynthesis protein CbiX n=1 Tax=Burkholderia singularis TaxID=1503053 RepID=A0A124P7W8_9BURK|nr:MULTISPECIES: CbiX/SirB N-terminal domain-containing protein [Burkholderia]AOK30379.1 cobalamin biosynthesis protein CbiX [Burkholderia sp. Bp7605]KVE23529.1 cobalamin biosynthesis protein CbiX [Burkholderia singularis]
MNRRSGIILFGHGARDARWAEPFERLAAKLRAARGAHAPVALAFLELMEPSLATAAAALAAQCDVITVIPVFFGQGGHVRRDLPQLVEACRLAHPGIDIRCATAVGEDDAVLDAIVEYCLRQGGEPMR